MITQKFGVFRQLFQDLREMRGGVKWKGGGRAQAESLAGSHAPDTGPQNPMILKSAARHTTMKEVPETSEKPSLG